MALVDEGKPILFASGFSSPAEYDSLVKVWQSIRTSIGTFDTLVMTLLTQGTALMFVAFGVILGNAKTLGPLVTAWLSSGFAFGIAMLFLGVWRYTNSIQHAVASAEAVEGKLFGTDPNDPRRLTTVLGGFWLSAKRHGLLYYRLWAGIILVGALTVAGWQWCVPLFGHTDEPRNSSLKAETEVLVHLRVPAPQTPIRGRFKGFDKDWILVATQGSEFMIHSNDVLMLELPKTTSSGKP